MGWQVLENEVRRVVLENTADVEPRVPSRLLIEKFFRNPQTIDIVYEKIIERVQTDRTRNPLILLRSLDVLKRYLVNYMPSLPIVESLDQFCCSVGAKDAQTRNTLIYIRALLQRPRYRATSETPVPSRKTPRRSTLSNINSVPKRIMGSSWTGSGLREARVQLQEAILRSNWVISNHIVARNRPNFDAVLNTRHMFRILSNHPYFCPFVVGSQPIDSSNERFAIEQHRIEERIKTVRSAKKSEEIAACKNAGIPVRRNPVQLFQFKYYNQQEALVLTEQELEHVVQAVVSGESYETRLIGSKILIKVLVDRFISDPENASKFFTTIVSDMLETEEEETHIHAFNLLFNLSVHFNLWEDITQVEHDGDQSPAVRHVTAIQRVLFDVLQEMLRILLQCEESNPLSESQRVWSTALNCLLFWTTKDGKFQKDMSMKLDITLIPPFLKNTSSAGDFTQRHLIRILCSLLYDENNLLLSQLKKVGGIFWVLDQYTSVRSTEAMDNLFVVIYDYVISTIPSKKKSPRVCDVYLELLKRINAPLLFVKFFRYTPAKYVDSIVQFISGEEDWNLSLSCDGSLELIDRKTLRKIIKGFKTLAQKYLSLSSEFQKLYQTSVETGDIGALDSYLRSNRTDNRKYAELWLFQLLSEQWLGNKAASPLGKQAYKLFLSLVEEKRDPLISVCHTTFLSIIERLVVYLSFQVHSEEQRVANAQSIISLLNEHLLKILELETLSEENTRKIFDILWGFTYCTGVYRPEGNPYGETNMSDCLYSLFVRSAAVLPQQLKSEIDILVFSFLFDNLVNKNYSEIRLAVLLVMIEKCMVPENLEEIGGIPFFRKLLASRDAAIAYHASRFLIDQLEAEKPEEYKEIMAAFLNKAQQTKNETLVANSYLQIKALIRGSDVK